MSQQKSGKQQAIHMTDWRTTVATIALDASRSEDYDNYGARLHSAASDGSPRTRMTDSTSFSRFEFSGVLVGEDVSMSSRGPR